MTFRTVLVHKMKSTVLIKRHAMTSLAPLEPASVERMKKTAIQVVEEMLIDRGYHIHFIDHHLTSQETYTVKASKDGEWMIVFINDEEKVNIDAIKERMSILNREGASKSIIIYLSTVTPSAKKSIETAEYKFELFGLNELQLNITRHRLVPRHLAVTEEERKMLDDKFKGKLPQILVTDPVSRYFAFSRGQYIRIHRKDGSMMYRVVK